MTISAAGKPRSADRASLTNSRDGRGLGVTEKHALLQFFARPGLFANLFHLLLHEILELAPSRDFPLLSTEISILLGKTSHEITDVCRIPVRKGQTRVIHVEFEQMTGLAVFFIANLEVINAGGIGFVAVGAIEFFAIGQSDSGKMQLMVKLQRVRVLELVSEHLELRMIGGEAVNDFGVTPLGAGSLEKNSALVGAIIEGGWRLRFADANGSFHNFRIGMARDAILIRRAVHRAGATMLLMAS